MVFLDAKLDSCLMVHPIEVKPIIVSLRGSVQADEEPSIVHEQSPKLESSWTGRGDASYWRLPRGRHTVLVETVFARLLRRIHGNSGYKCCENHSFRVAPSSQARALSKTDWQMGNPLLGYERYNSTVLTTCQVLTSG